MSARPLALDLTRSVQRARHPTPSGIDRVERAYLDHVLARGGWGLVAIGGRQHVLEPEALAALAAMLDAPSGWMDLRAMVDLRRHRGVRLLESAVRRQASAAGGAEAAARALPAGAAVLIVGHDNLDAGLMAALAGAGHRAVAMVHDVIPLTHPEHVRPETPRRFRAKFRAMAGAAHLIFNSAATRDAAIEAAAGEGLALPGGTVLPLGIAPLAGRSSLPLLAGAGERPAFVVLGTIEGRKNHALLLDLWEGFEAEGEAPVLHIVGRRGWRAEEVFARLDTAPMMGRSVFEQGGAGDAEVAALMAGARAVLFPSHAEGYGLPLAEALAAGVPVIASDLPALREVGGDVPDWLAPDDRTGWAAAIRDHAALPSQRREAQLARMAGWRAPTWEAHFAGLEAVLATL